jgi:hypothetical protein
MHSNGRMRLGILLLAVAGCASVRAHGTWAGDTHVGTLITAAAIAVGVAVEGDDQSRTPFCDDNDPPHTCPGTTPGPLSPPPPGPD